MRIDCGSVLSTTQLKRTYYFTVTVVLEPLDEGVFSVIGLFLQGVVDQSWFQIKHPTWDESSHLSLGYSSPLSLNLVEISKATFHSNLLLVAKWKLFVSQDREFFY